MQLHHERAEVYREDYEGVILVLVANQKQLHDLVSSPLGLRSVHQQVVWLRS